MLGLYTSTAGGGSSWPIQSGTARTPKPPPLDPRVGTQAEGMKRNLRIGAFPAPVIRREQRERWRWPWDALALSSPPAVQCLDRGRRRFRDGLQRARLPSSCTFGSTRDNTLARVRATALEAVAAFRARPPDRPCRPLSRREHGWFDRVCRVSLPTCHLPCEPQRQADTNGRHAMFGIEFCAGP